MSGLMPSSQALASLTGIVGGLHASEEHRHTSVANEPVAPNGEPSTDVQSDATDRASQAQADKLAEQLLNESTDQFLNTILRVDPSDLSALMSALSPTVAREFHQKLLAAQALLDSESGASKSSASTTDTPTTTSGSSSASGSTSTSPESGEGSAGSFGLGAPPNQNAPGAEEKPAEHFKSEDVGASAPGPGYDPGETLQTLINGYWNASLLEPLYGKQLDKLSDAIFGKPRSVLDKKTGDQGSTGESTQSEGTGDIELTNTSSGPVDPLVTGEAQAEKSMHDGPNSTSSESNPVNIPKETTKDTKTVEDREENDAVKDDAEITSETDAGEAVVDAALTDGA